MKHQNLTLIDHIRKRPGMFIGYLSFHGIINIVAFFLDDILINNKGKFEVNIYFHKNNYIAIEIKNINTNLFTESIEKLTNDKGFVSLGLPIIIALGEQAEINISNNGTIYTLSSKNGNYQYSKAISNHEDSHLKVNFKADEAIFESNLDLNYEVFNQFFRKYSSIHFNCKIISRENRTPIAQTICFNYPKGLSNILDLKIAKQDQSPPFLRLDLITQIDNYEYQICFSFHSFLYRQTKIKTFANYDELIYGGSLEDGIIDGLFLAFKELANKKNIEVSRKKIKKHLILMAAIKGENFNFYRSTRTELNMPKVRKAIKQFVADRTLIYLKENNMLVDKILNEFE